jgi:hypothetical protein
MISRTGHTGAVKSPMAPTYSRMRTDSTNGAQAAHRMTAMSSAPTPWKAACSSAAPAGRLRSRRSSSTSARVKRPLCSVSASCRKTMPTIDSDTSSVTPRTGAPSRLRPSTSLLISSISATIHSVPSALSPRISRCRPKGSGKP